MNDESLQVGDAVEILPLAALPVGQPPAPGRYGVVVAVDPETRRASVRLPGRIYPLELPFNRLRRLT